MGRREGVAVIKDYIGPGPYYGSDRVVDHTKWAIAEYMDHAWPVGQRHSNANHAKVLGIKLVTYHKWRRAAVNYRKTHKGCALKATAPDLKNPHNMRAGKTGTPKPQPNRVDALTDDQSADVAQIADACGQKPNEVVIPVPPSPKPLDPSTWPGICIVFAEGQPIVVGLDTQAAAELVTKLRQG